MNIPNLLTLIRFLLIPLFVYVFFSDMSNHIIIASIIFVTAGITDMLDGYIARKYKLITRLGIVMDPLADKLMMLTVLVSITIWFKIPLWIIGVVAVKESLMILGAIALYRNHDVVVPANKYGKVTTILSYVAILAVVFKLPYNWLLLDAFIILTLVSLTVYLNNFVNIRKKHDENVKKDSLT